MSRKLIKNEETGEFTYEIILKHKPKTNEIIIPIKAKGMRFVQQPHPDKLPDEESVYRVAGYFEAPITDFLDVKPIERMPSKPVKAHVEIKDGVLTLTLSPIKEEED